MSRRFSGAHASVTPAFSHHSTSPLSRGCFVQSLVYKISAISELHTWRPVLLVAEAYDLLLFGGPQKPDLSAALSRVSQGRPRSASARRRLGTSPCRFGGYSTSNFTLHSVEMTKVSATVTAATDSESFGGPLIHRSIFSKCFLFGPIRTSLIDRRANRQVRNFGKGHAPACTEKSLCLLQCHHRSVPSTMPRRKPLPEPVFITVDFRRL